MEQQRILVVEEDPDILNDLVCNLERAQFRVLSVLKMEEMPLKKPQGLNPASA